MQQHIGVTPDGFWGPKSIAACQKHLRAMMPVPHPWPASDQASLTKFYGAAGDESRLAPIDVEGLGLKYDGSAVRRVRCHAKVAASLKRALIELSRSPHAWVLEEYAGCYVNRAMRGGSLPSLHARGAAIDLAPGRNGNKTPWPVSSTMPLEVMEIFAREGWLSAGAFWGRDGMHFQATR